MNLSLVSILFISLVSFSASSNSLKISTLAPEGTTWANNLKDLAKQVKKATKGKVKFKVYYGGVAGDEPDVLRKIRIGQMHGGIFTGRALGDVYKDVRVMEVPFNFKKDRTLMQKVLKDLTPDFNKGFESNGFKNLGFFEIGQVYLVSTKEIKDLSSLNGLKVWAWEGDDVAEALVKEMKLVSVPLALPDVLSSLSTGVIDAAYNSTMGVLALQWNSKVKYIVDYPVTYSIGAFLISKKRWDKISPDHQKIVSDLVNKFMEKNSDETIKENSEALVALKAGGAKVITFPEGDVSKGDTINKNLFTILQKENFLSKDIVNKFINSKGK